MGRPAARRRNPAITGPPG